MINTQVSCAQCVPAVALERTVCGAAAAPTMVPVTPSMAPVNVTQGGSAATAPSVCSLSNILHHLYGGSDTVTVL